MPFSKVSQGGSGEAIPKSIPNVCAHPASRLEARPLFGKSGAKTLLRLWQWRCRKVNALAHPLLPPGCLLLTQKPSIFLPPLAGEESVHRDECFHISIRGRGYKPSKTFIELHPASPIPFFKSFARGFGGSLFKGDPRCMCATNGSGRSPCPNRRRRIAAAGMRRISGRARCRFPARTAPVDDKTPPDRFFQSIR